MKKRLIASLIAAAMCFAIPAQALGVYDYGSPGDTNHFVYYRGAYDPAANPQKSLDSVFTSEPVLVDGILDAAYSSAPVSAIVNTKVLDSMQYANDQSAALPTGTLRSVWDGPVLYLFVEVTDATPEIKTSIPANGGAMTSKPAVPTDRDSVVFGVDLHNDKVVYETDTTAVFTIDSSGNLTFFRSGIPSLGSVHADPIHPEYTDRIKGYSATPTSTGYNVELALQIEGTQLQNGTQFGVDVQICNVQELQAYSVTQRNPWYPWWGPEFMTTNYPAGPGRSSNTFWSHNQNSLYAEFDHERPNAADWGNITLTGWNGADEFAFSSWSLLKNLDYLNSIRFPKGVWTAQSQQNLDLAVTQANDLITQSNTVTQAVYEAVYAQFPAAAFNLQNTIEGLRWADTTYPDPMDLPNQFTLPNPYKFFGSDGNSTRLVRTSADWEERRQEILDLAQFYEYGYKPAAPDAMIVDAVTYSTNSKNYRIETKITYGNVTKSLQFRLNMPTDEQLQASGHADNVPVVLSFDGKIDAYLQAGIAVMEIPAVTGGDVRTNEYAWGTRTGIFYEFFPYSRNGQGALREVSSEMAAAWGTSRAIDALELLLENTTIVNGKEVGKMASADKLAVTGFSINGKYAFVSAVFDDRIDVCIPGAAGATGPSPWRYVYAGQSYDWSDTIWAPNGAAQQVAFGTEFMANSVRHNRVRETETFRRFLTPGNFYKKLEGAYGYGTRLPFDQNDLVAALAPRAIIVENTINDYNDGSVTDALSLDLVKTIYSNLKLDADNLIKYNYRTVQPTGDPHGNDAAQRSRSAEYLNYYFYGTALSEATNTWLSTNPYTLNVSDNKTQSPYDYYYGGYNTITGGTAGINGTDGWYSYKITGPAIQGMSLSTGDEILAVDFNCDKQAVWYASIAKGDYPLVNAQTYSKTGTAIAGKNRISFTGLDTGATYYISLLFVDDLNNETSGLRISGVPTPISAGSTPPPAVSNPVPSTAPTSIPAVTPTVTPTPAEKPIGTETITEEEGITTLVLKVDPQAVEEQMKEALKDDTKTQKKTIDFAVSDAKADHSAVSLTGDLIRKLAENDFELSVRRNNVTYTISASDFDIAGVAENLGQKDLKAVEVEIRINEVSEEVKAKYEEVVKNNRHELVFPPVEFEVVAKTQNADGTEKHVHVDRFSNYVTRTVEIPEGVDPISVTTGIVFNADGTYEHVPTVVFEQNGKWYARLSSLTNSTYSVLSNAVRVASVENHWSKEAVNDLASRLVILNPKSFEPNGLITRGKFAQYIAKALGLRTSAARKQFTDVAADSPLSDDIAAAVEYGIIKGFVDGTFKPDATITRQEAMAMYARAMDVAGLEAKNPDRIEGYSDKDKVSEWAYEEVKKVLAAGVFNGTSATTISPLETFTFAEAATAVRNLLIQSGLINE